VGTEEILNVMGEANEWRKLHNDGLWDLYAGPLTRKIKSRSMRWVRNDWKR
jgi:hypothetical protein